MPEEQPWIYNYAGYQAQILYTEDAANPTARDRTEWQILDRASGNQTASGWGSTPSEIREQVEEKLVELRTTGVGTAGSNPPIDEDAT